MYHEASPQLPLQTSLCKPHCLACVNHNCASCSMATSKHVHMSQNVWCVFITWRQLMTLKTSSTYSAFCGPCLRLHAQPPSRYMHKSLPHMHLSRYATWPYRKQCIIQSAGGKSAAPLTRVLIAVMQRQSTVQRATPKYGKHK